AAPAPAGAKENERTDLAVATAPKIRPQEKHMTAKLQSPIQFDSSDQVQMAPAANAREKVSERENAPAQAQNGVTASRMLEESAATPQTMAKAKDTGTLSYATGTASAQSAVAASKLEGAVLDQSGAVVSHAEVTIVGPIGSKTVTSDGAGKFKFDQLTPG